MVEFHTDVFALVVQHEAICDILVAPRLVGRDDNVIVAVVTCAESHHMLVICTIDECQDTGGGGLSSRLEEVGIARVTVLHEDRDEIVHKSAVALLHRQLIISAECGRIISIVSHPCR